MRLTLRNLLAYMDDLLDPESARIIGQKTEESEFASGLLHRIRDVTRRTKLGAPEVIDRKAALDPNTVAEYLDNILSPDRVTDFERACLESDVELAEVAACHQILTLVLGEPAEVRPESRVRMYHLPETAASRTYVESDKPDIGQESVRIDTPTPPERRHRHPEIPEYLLEAKRRRQRLYGLATVVGLVCVVAYLGATGRLSGLLGSGEKPSPPNDQVAINMPTQPTLPEGTDSLPEPVASGVPASEEPAPAQEVPAETVSVPPVEPTEGTVASEPSETTVVAPGANVEPAPTPDSVVAVTPTPPPSTANASSEVPIPVTPLESPVPSPGATPDPGQVASMIPAVSPDDREPIVAEPMVPEVVQGREIGRLVKGDELALVSDGDGEPFRGIVNTEPLRIGQRIVSLPGSRPFFLFDGNLNVEMVDGGELRLLPSNEGEPLHLEITSGRVLFAPSAEAGAVKVLVTAGDVSGMLSLADSTTLVALEVGRADGPIVDPLTQPVPTTAQMWAVFGKFSWEASGEAEAAFERPMMVDLVAGSGSAPVPVEAPSWVQPDATGGPDQRLGERALGLLKKMFDYERPADLILRESAYHRLKEMRRLARQSLSWIEDFEPIVEVLNDPEPYVEWPEVIDLLRDSVRRGPRTAQAVLDAMNAAYGDRGNDLFELLWKYDNGELSPEAAKQLVQYLTDRTLACRVLSFNNLNRITGLGFYYRADDTELERRPSVQRWNAWAERVSATSAPASPTDAPPDGAGK